MTELSDSSKNSLAAVSLMLFLSWNSHFPPKSDQVPEVSLPIRKYIFPFSSTW